MNYLPSKKPDSEQINTCRSKWCVKGLGTSETQWLQNVLWCRSISSGSISRALNVYFSHVSGTYQIFNAKWKMVEREHCFQGRLCKVANIHATREGCLRLQMQTLDQYDLALEAEPTLNLHWIYLAYLNTWLWYFFGDGTIKTT